MEIENRFVYIVDSRHCFIIGSCPLRVGRATSATAMGITIGGVDGVNVNKLRAKWGSAGLDAGFDGNGLIDGVDINIFHRHQNQVVPFF